MKGKERIKITAADLNIPNKFHFNIQKNTRAAVFKDKTKYNRKVKHKNKDYE